MINGAPVNVLDYGATGNGVTNDAAAIQAALDTGNAVYIPQGDYIIGTPLKVQTSHQMIFGDGTLSSLITTTDIETAKAADVSAPASALTTFVCVKETS